MRKRDVKRIIYMLGVLITLVVTSCAPAYVPNVVNSPVFNNEGEFQGSLHAGLAGYDAQFAYAITDHVGVMLNGSYANRTSDSTDNFHKHKFAEIGAGYYGKIKENGRYEVYGGGGFGKLQAYQEVAFWQAYADVNSLRFFVQPAIGLSTSNGVFDGSFAARLIGINLKQDTFSNTGMLVEPAITAKVGYKYVKAVFQFGMSIPLNKNNIDFNYQPFLFSFGLQATFGRKYK
ncbi:MAG: hypothetical protein JW973_13140 [Bacteroidales bacterium]|nr:hypothetical protein [Bacteroidales bacterium]